MQTVIIIAMLFIFSFETNAAEYDVQTDSADNRSQTVLVSQVNDLANQYYDAWIERYPTKTYFIGVPINKHNKLMDN